MPTGQGFGQAAEDAHELAAQLAARGFTAEALRAYEAARGNRMKRIADTELMRLSLERKRLSSQARRLHAWSCSACALVPQKILCVPSAAVHFKIVNKRRCCNKPA